MIGNECVGFARYRSEEQRNVTTNGGTYMKQNDAVFSAVCKVLGKDGFNDAVILSKEQRDEVVAIVTQGIINGSVDFSTEAKAKHDTEAKIKSYTTGMVSNHLRKDKRLNGGVKHEIKNPGSRAGNSDEQVKALKALRSSVTSPEQIRLVDEEIEKRMNELKAVKAKTVEINIDLLPEHLRHLVK